MIERDKILEKTNRGYNIFTHYIGKDVQRKLFSNPFRQDTSPSCRLYYNKRHGGIWVMIDYGASEWSGDCFNFAGRIHNLDPNTEFRELLKVIDKEMDLFIMSDKPSGYHPIVLPAPPAAGPDTPIDFKSTYQSFRHHEVSYWSRYGITLDILERYEVRSLRKCQFFPPDKPSYTYFSTYLKPMYGYTFNQGTGIKIYRPFSNVRFLYAGHLPKPYIFGWNQLPSSGQYLFITGGEKDVMTLAVRGFAAVAFNSESAKIPEDIMYALSQRFEHIIFLYDCDNTGLRESAVRLQEFSESYVVNRLVLPLDGTKTSKDISDYFRSGHTVEEFSKLLTTITY